MQLSFSTNAFRKASLDQALAEIAGAGYQGVEIMADRPHAWPPDLDGRAIDRIREQLDRTGMEVSNVNGFMMCAVEDFWHPSWIEPVPAYRELRVAHTAACLELAARIGAPSVSTEPGGPLSPGMERAVALELFLEGLSRVTPVAERLDVDLLVEPEPGLLVESAGQFLDLIQRVDNPRVGLNLDLGHHFCVGEDLVEVVRLLAPHIRHVHLEDIPADRSHHHLMPGEGAVPLEQALRALSDIGYEGFITVELYTYQEDPIRAARKAHRLVSEMLR